MKKRKTPPHRFAVLLLLLCGLIASAQEAQRRFPDTPEITAQTNTGTLVIADHEPLPEANAASV